MNTLDTSARSTGYTTEELIAMREKYGANHYHTEPTCVFSHGKGVYVWDINGKKYIDMNATYSAQAVGHSNHELEQAISRQMRRLANMQNRLITDVHPLLLKCISEITGQDTVILMNTGAEIVDTAVKTARRWAYRVKGVYKDKAEIITAHNNFHGRTLNAIGMSSVEKYRDDFGPYAPGYIHIPFGDIKALENAVTRETAAFIVEPIQGEGGINVPPPGYLKHVRRLCDIYGVLLIFDEIQTGLGRTGKLFASEWWGVKPDAILLGKALGGYIPVSAMAGRKELMDVFTPGSHGSTFGGNALSCAAALKCIEMILHYDRALVRNSAEVGAYFLERLLAAGCNARGKGLFIGVELDPKKKNAEDAFHSLLNDGVISGVASNNVIRLTPPLIITKEQVDSAMPALVKAFL